MGQKYWMDWQDEQAREYGVDAYEQIFSDDIIYSECYGPVYKGIG